MSERSPIPLGSEKRDRIAADRNWVKGHVTVRSDEKYGSIEGKLRLIEAILENGWVEREETWKLQALGIAFGDALAQKLTLDWITVDDEMAEIPRSTGRAPRSTAFP